LPLHTAQNPDWIDRINLGLAMAVLFTLIADNPKRGIVGEKTTLDVQHKKGSEEQQISCTLNWDVDVLGVPGAIIVENNYYSAALYIKNITIYIPKHGNIVFPCNSCVYPQSYYHYNRVFFANKVSVCL
jgi:linoleate 9S-lipoxygenase